MSEKTTLFAYGQCNSPSKQKIPGLVPSLGQFRKRNSRSLGILGDAPSKNVLSTHKDDFETMTISIISGADLIIYSMLKHGKKIHKTG